MNNFIILVVSINSMEVADIVKAKLAYPNLDFTVDTYIKEFETSADAEDVFRTVEKSELLDIFGEETIFTKDWVGVMELLSQRMDSVDGVVGSGLDFDRGFERCWFDVDEDDSRDSITVECKEGRRRWVIEFDASDIDIRHNKIFEEEDEEIERRLQSGQDAGWRSSVSSEGDSFRNEFINVHIERLDDACYFIGGDDANRQDVYHKVWIEPSSESTTLRYTIHFDEYES
jgi:hypothetical protein